MTSIGARGPGIVLLKQLIYLVGESFPYLNYTIENYLINFKARFRLKSLWRCKVIWKRITSVSVLQLSVWNMRKRVMSVSMERTLTVSITSDKVKRESLSSK
jgi:hypothetical protein